MLRINSKATEKKVDIENFTHSHIIKIIKLISQKQSFPCRGRVALCFLIFTL